MVLDGTVHINSPPRIKEVNVKYGISECNVWDVNDEGRVDSIPKIFCSACKTQLGGASSPYIEHIYGAAGTDWMELPHQKANLFQSVSCGAEKFEDSQSAHYPHNTFFPADSSVRKLCLSEENLFLHEQIIEKASSMRLDSRNPALSGNYYPSRLEGQMQYQDAVLDETLEKVHTMIDCSVEKGSGSDAHVQQLRHVRTFAILVPLFGVVLWIVQATCCLPALESGNQIMLLIVMGLGLNVSEMVIFLAHQDIVVAIGCFISVCLGSCSFFCTILVAGSPSWIDDCTFNDQSFQEAELTAFVVNLLLVIQATMLLLSSLCVRAVLAEHKRMASFDRITTI